MANLGTSRYGITIVFTLAILAACSGGASKTSFDPASAVKSDSSQLTKLNASPVAGPAAKGFQWYSAQVNVQPNQLSIASLNCPTGHPFVVSGGGSGAGYGLSIIASYPNTSSNGWDIEVNDSYESGSKAVTVFALCKKA